MLQQRPRPSRSPRAGLTLLEVLLAASLGVILIGAIYAAIEQSWRLTRSGRIELERQQIARAVLRRIELDLRGTMFTPQVTTDDESSAVDDSGLAAAMASAGLNSSGSVASSNSGSTGSSTGSSNTGSSGSGSGSSTGSSTTSTTEEEGEVSWTASVGIRGSMTELVIDVSHTKPVAVTDVTASPLSTDLQTVTYGIGNADALVLSTGATGPLARSDADGFGLMRRQGDRSSIAASGDGGGTSMGSTQLLAPEISSIQFRYFNGLNWETEWDSVTNEGLPRAVEVTIVFDPPPATGRLLASSVSASSTQYRRVIAIPTSDPIMTEESY